MAVTAARRVELLRGSIAPFLRFFDGAYSRLQGDPEVANFAVGNPHELAMPAYVSALSNVLEPKNEDWYGYKMSEPKARLTVARSLAALTGLDWDARDVHMTNGGFAAIAVTLRTLLEQDDEAIFMSPPWFFYEQLILAAGGLPVRVRFDMPACRLDLSAIEAAITARTRVVMVNSPHNPSGRIVPASDLQALADLLTSASARIGHTIYLLSDEPYRRILFDGNEFHSPAEFYPHTVITYSYGKQLLAPGMRIGYLTWPPTMPERERLRDEAFVQQLAAGYAFPNADLQHALPELEGLVIDLAAMQSRRDRLVAALEAQGYEPTVPDGTFYVMARSPWPDDEAFAEVLNRHRVLVLPGTIVEVPGWFRISLTASEAMTDAGIPRFAAAMEEARTSA